MQNLLDFWTAYHAWASDLGDEGRFYFFAGCLILLSIYAMINFTQADAAAPAKAAKAKKPGGDDQRRSPS